ncbi:T9SS type A sorting domain-containing protein [bacterium]|nr:T9SS type A sorting domain-containing protein [bacterium]
MLALLLLLFPLSLFAQPDTLWSRNFLLGERCYLQDAVLMDDGTAILGGWSETGSGSTLDQDYMLAAYSATGESLYVRSHLETEDDEAIEGLVRGGGDTLAAIGWFFNGRGWSFLFFSADDGELLWSRTYQPINAGLMRGRDITRLTDGGYAATGYRLGVNGISSDIWVFRTDFMGDTLWTRMFGGEGTDVGTSIRQKDNGNLLITGQTRASGGTEYDVIALEVDLQGNQVGAAQTIGTPDNDIVYNLLLDAENNCHVVGRTALESALQSYVVILPTTGQTFTRQYFQTGIGEQFRGGIPWYGGMLYAGRSGISSSQTRFYMRAVDVDGTSLWTWNYGNLGIDCGYTGILALEDGGGLAYGQRSIAPDVKGYILRFAPPGGAQGHVTADVSGLPVTGAHVHKLGDANYVVTGSTGLYRIELAPGTHSLVVESDCIVTDTIHNVVVLPNELATADFVVGQALYDPLQSSVNVIARNHVSSLGFLTLGNAGTGDLHFSAEASSISPPGNWISVSPSEGVITGESTFDLTVSVLADTTDDGMYDYTAEITVHTNACPDTLLTFPVLISVLDVPRSDVLPVEFRLSPAYPNPFNGMTSVTLELPAETSVKVRLFNLEGQLVSTVLEGNLSSGEHRLTVDMSNQATGIYWLRAETPSSNSVQKLVLVR